MHFKVYVRNFHAFTQAVNSLTDVSCHYQQGCRQGGGGGGAGGAEAPPDLNSCYFTAKER